MFVAAARPLNPNGDFGPIQDVSRANHGSGRRCRSWYRRGSSEVLFSTDDMRGEAGEVVLLEDAMFLKPMLDPCFVYVK